MVAPPCYARCMKLDDLLAWRPGADEGGRLPVNRPGSRRHRGPYRDAVVEDVGHRDNGLARLTRDFERVIAMKPEKPAPSVDDIELYPDAMERLERAVKIAARHPPVKHPTAPRKSKPKNPRATRP